jgi:hypothetical protein
MPPVKSKKIRNEWKRMENISSADDVKILGENVNTTKKKTESLS